MPSHHESQLTRLLLQMGRGSSTPSRELVNHVLSEPERIDDKVEVLSHPAQTLLHRSVSLGQNAVAMWLVMKGADINAFDGNGRTPLDHAITGGQKKLVDYLRSKGAFSAVDHFVDNLNGVVTDMVNHPPLATINASQTVDQAAPANKDENKRFIDNKDGSVTDTHTDLIWMRCAFGKTWDGRSCTGVAKPLTWDQAMALNLDFAGHNDWRVPNIDELKSLITSARSYRNTYNSIFPNAPNAAHWSSSPSTKDLSLIQFVQLPSGSIETCVKDNGFGKRVRLVRGGKSLTSSIAPTGADTNSEINKSIELARMVANDPKSMPSVPNLDSNGNSIYDVKLTGKPQNPESENKDENKRFIDNRDGSVTDTHTDLIWMRCALGQTWDGATCTGTADGYSWNSAIATHATFAGHSDWRTADIDELLTIVDPKRSDPAIDITVFPNTPNQIFWSATSANSNCAHYVSFLSGSTFESLKTNSNCVRLVRGGSTKVSSAKINPDSVKTSIKPPAVANNSDRYLPEKIAVHVSIDEILKRLDLLETRFDEAIDRIEISLDPIPAGQSEILNAICQLQPPSSVNTNNTTEDISGLRLLIEHQEVRFNSTINSIEVLLKSLFQTQAAAWAAMTQVQQTSAANTEILAREIVELRQMIVTALQSVPPTTKPPPTTNSEPKVSDLDSKAVFLAWLVEQDAISLSDLRIRLLPLDLLPSAVINDINERAIDLTGEPALEENGDSVIVYREVLLQVIAAWSA